MRYKRRKALSPEVPDQTAIRAVETKGAARISQHSFG